MKGLVRGDRLSTAEVPSVGAISLTYDVQAPNRLL